MDYRYKFCSLIFTGLLVSATLNYSAVAKTNVSMAGQWELTAASYERYVNSGCYPEQKSTRFPEYNIKVEEIFQKEGSANLLLSKKDGSTVSLKCKLTEYTNLGRMLGLTSCQEWDLSSKKFVEVRPELASFSTNIYDYSLDNLSFSESECKRKAGVFHDSDCTCVCPNGKSFNAGVLVSFVLGISRTNISKEDCFSKEDSDKQPTSKQLAPDKTPH